ncbi:MAG TPA: tRNA (adenosine(37)-N6)-threonylcarbamoyltransferase complex dimerization subunit type 1 TsaB [Catenuloplanes sp.]|jgi:tRNA threonylcarbamoyladenosine biosynthesis protein TsaB
MSVTLVVETSSPSYGAAVSRSGELLAHETVRRGGPAFHSVGHLVASCLETAGMRFADLDSLAVDCGPGNLNSVRAGVAYVNGLAFSLGKPVFAAGSLEVLAVQAAAEAPHLPVLCVRRTQGGVVFAGLYPAGFTGPVAGDHPPVLRTGPLAETVSALVSGVTEFTVAGPCRGELKELLPDRRVHDSGVEFPSVLALHQLLAARGARAVFAPFAVPRTDLSTPSS